MQRQGKVGERLVMHLLSHEKAKLPYIIFLYMGHVYWFAGTVPCIMYIYIYALWLHLKPIISRAMQLPRRGDVSMGGVFYAT